jgi:hypothetical protein
MPIDIGKLIQAEVENQRLTQKEFGALINKNEKTVPDIYDRPTMSTDLLVTISIALKKDFLKLYYKEEGMQHLRDDEVTKLNIELQKVKEQNKQQEKELALMRDLIEANKDRVLLLSEKIVEYERVKNDSENKSTNDPRQ